MNRGILIVGAGILAAFLLLKPKAVAAMAVPVNLPGGRRTGATQPGIFGGRAGGQ